MSLPIEQWRPVPGFEGFYEVSDHGRVRSVDRVIERAGIPTRYRGRLKAARLDTDGRPTVNLYRRGSHANARVHILVLTTFVGPRPDGMDACHNDGNPLNNRLDNLRWDTKSENMRDAVRHRTHANTRKSHCVAGHPLSGDNLRTYMRDGRPRRACRACTQRHSAAHHAGDARSVTCPYCEQPFRRDTLRRHVRNRHSALTAALSPESVQT